MSVIKSSAASSPPSACRARLLPLRRTGFSSCASHMRPLSSGNPEVPRVSSRYTHAIWPSNNIAVIKCQTSGYGIFELDMRERLSIERQVAA